MSNEMLSLKRESGVLYIVVTAPSPHLPDMHLADAIVYLSSLLYLCIIVLFNRHYYLTTYIFSEIQLLAASILN